MVTCPLCSSRIDESFPLLGSRIQIPFGAGTVQVQNRSDIILQDAVDVETTGDQATCLEKVIVVLDPCVLSCTIFGLGESAVLVDPGSFSYLSSGTLQTELTLQAE